MDALVWRHRVYVALHNIGFLLGILLVILRLYAAFDCIYNAHRMDCFGSRFKLFTGFSGMLHCFVFSPPPHSRIPRVFVFAGMTIACECGAMYMLENAYTSRASLYLEWLQTAALPLTSPSA